MGKKIGLLQIISFVIIAGLLVLLVVMQRSYAAQMAALPIPNTGSDATAALPELDSSQNTLITLADGTLLELIPGTEVEILSETDPGQITIDLLHGEMLVLPSTTGDTSINIQTAKGYKAQFQGCSMSVAYKPEEDSFSMDCIDGQCSLVAKNGDQLSADAGMTWSFTDGIILNPQAIVKDDLLKKYVSGLPECPVKPTKTVIIPETGGHASPTATVAVATETPTPQNTVAVPVTGGTAAPNRAATATAACSLFESQFPGTPCP